MKRIKPHFALICLSRKIGCLTALVFCTACFGLIRSIVDVEFERSLRRNNIELTERLVVSTGKYSAHEKIEIHEDELVIKSLGDEIFGYAVHYGYFDVMQRTTSMCSLAEIGSDRAELHTVDIEKVLRVRLPCVVVEKIYLFDVNGDGIRDVVVRQKMGAPFPHPSNQEMVAVYLVLLRKNGNLGICSNIMSSVKLSQNRYMKLLESGSISVVLRKIGRDAVFRRASCSN